VGHAAASERPEREDAEVARTNDDQVGDLTGRQRQVLSALRRLHERAAFAPTLRELGAEVGLSSTSSVHAHVRVLEARGLVERSPGQPRTLHPTVP
jgi:repressor LexA